MSFANHINSSLLATHHFIMMTNTYCLFFPQLLLYMAPPLLHTPFILQPHHSRVCVHVCVCVCYILPFCLFMKHVYVCMCVFVYVNTLMHSVLFCMSLY